MSQIRRLLARVKPVDLSSGTPQLSCDDQVARELASHCAVLTLELEKACRDLAELETENSRLRRELAQQRRCATVVAFPTERVRQRKQR